MSTLRDILDRGTPSFSFEFFPPKTAKGERTLWEAIRSPRRVFLLLVGNAVNAMMYAGVYMCCIAAMSSIM